MTKLMELINLRVKSGEQFPMVIWDSSGSFGTGCNTTWKPKDSRPFLVLIRMPTFEGDNDATLRGQTGRTVRFASRASAQKRADDVGQILRASGPSI